MPGMSEHVRPPQAKLAEPLGEDEIHVWSCAYRPGVGRAPLRRLLARYLGCEADTLQLHEEEHGRPTLLTGRHAALCFNWSHSGERALVAVARTVQPGIDLEHRGRRTRDVLALARRFFAKAEATALERCDDTARVLQFLRFWTAKEALLKAQGRGLAFGMERVVVSFDLGGPELLAFEGEALEDWHLEELMCDETWVAALAWRGPSMEVRWRGDFE